MCKLLMSDFGLSFVATPALLTVEACVVFLQIPYVSIQEQSIARNNFTAVCACSWSVLRTCNFEYIGTVRGLCADRRGAALFVKEFTKP